MEKKKELKDFNETELKAMLFDLRNHYMEVEKMLVMKAKAKAAVPVEEKKEK
jgi:hypothetical protein